MNLLFSRRVEYHFLEVVLRKIVELLVERERLLGLRFVVGLVILIEVRVGERVHDGDSFVRVERQHLVEQIQSCEA